ncbi:alpha/beta-hydrolase, partial [Plenodomus tracheiphilus IPT5]
MLSTIILRHFSIYTIQYNLLTPMSSTPSFSTPPAGPPSPRPNTTKSPPFSSDNSTSSILTLSSGRKLSYAQYGAPTGFPIFFLHGLPGSRLEGAYFDDLGKELGARIIAPERPGCGRSDEQPGRRLLDWAGDVEALAGVLGVQRYSVIGISGGAPYALSCAYALPASTLHSCTLICGLGPPDISMRGATLPHRLAFPYGWRHAPTFLLRSFFALDPIYRLHVPEPTRVAMKLSPAEQAKVTHPKDKAIYADEGVIGMVVRSMSEAFARGWAGVREDGRVVCREWGFGVEDVRKDLKVCMWYGGDDVCVPIGHGEEIKERLEG